VSLPPDTAERADAPFAVHATWAQGRTAGMMSRVTPELAFADSGLRCDTFNMICRARLGDTTARGAALAPLAHFARVERPFSWWLGPADRPRGLGTILEDLGLVRAESELAMALPLRAAHEAGSPVPGLEVRRVRTATELDAFAQLSAANWDPPDLDVLEFYRVTAPALLAPESPQWFYLGYLDGEPVATAEATLEAGTVGLFSIGTRPAFRRRGIASGVMRQMLHDAQAAGCDLAVLQAAEAGVGLYHRLGFTAFGEITEYKPRAQGSEAVHGSVRMNHAPERGGGARGGSQTIGVDRSL
jgi:ribosomal protein S18 acetylase RimI-like enzyme